MLTPERNPRSLSNISALRELESAGSVSVACSPFFRADAKNSPKSLAKKLRFPDRQVAVGATSAQVALLPNIPRPLGPGPSPRLCQEYVTFSRRSPDHVEGKGT